MNRKSIFFWSVFYILLFIGGYFLGPIIHNDSSPENQAPEVIVYSPAPANPKLDAANELRTKYIDGLGFHGDDIHGEKSRYLTTRKGIIDAYNAGDRSPNLMRAYIYMTSQEGNFAEREKVITEFCKTEDICSEFMVQIDVKGTVKNPQGNPIPDATVEILGTTIKTKTDKNGGYTLTFKNISPAVLRLQASSPNSMIGVNRINIVDTVTSASKVQTFRGDFTLTKAFSEIFIDTKKKTIYGEGTSKTEKGYLIVNPYTKYFIPFDAIVKGRDVYGGKLRAMIFEFDRQSSSYLLGADVFDQVGSLISQTMITFGMPFIIFTAENGDRLDVLSTNPMTIWTTNREADETNNLLLGKEYRDLFEAAYEDSQKSPGEYPINSLWEYNHGNKQVVPLFWVFNRVSGFWDNVGFRFVTNQFTSPYNIETIFYTVKSEK